MAKTKQNKYELKPCLLCGSVAEFQYGLPGCAHCELWFDQKHDVKRWNSLYGWKKIESLQIKLIEAERKLKFYREVIHSCPMTHKSYE